MTQDTTFKLIFFDMDGTLLAGRSIIVLSEKLGFSDELQAELQSSKQPFEKSIRIASFLQGIQSNDLLSLFRQIPLQDGVLPLVKVIKKLGIKTAIVTDSYQLLAEDMKKRLGFDYAFANNLILQDSIVTGEIELHNKTRMRCNSWKIYSICKGEILTQLCHDLSIPPSQTIAIGDGLVDISMIRRAGIGIAYRAPDELRRHADVITDDLTILLNYLEG